MLARQKKCRPYRRGTIFQPGRINGLDRGQRTLATPLVHHVLAPQALLPPSRFGNPAASRRSRPAQLWPSSKVSVLGPDVSSLRLSGS
jgi:hypothetical protein